MDKEEKQIDYMSYYVDPHEEVSRDVTDKDIERIKKDAEIMVNMCFVQRGIFPSAYALADQQITKKDPLRFFAFNNGVVIINPVIVRHTRHTIDSEEGCLSFPDNKPITVQRWNKCEVEFQEIEGDRLGEKQTKNLSSIEAKIFQHEIQHFDGSYIFDV